MECCVLWISCVDAYNQLSCLLNNELHSWIGFAVQNVKWEIHKEHFPFFLLGWDFIFVPIFSCFLSYFFFIFLTSIFQFFPYYQVSVKSYLPSRAVCLVLMMRRFFFQSLVNHECFLIFFCFLSALPSPYTFEWWLWMTASGVSLSCAFR